MKATRSEIGLSEKSRRRGAALAAGWFLFTSLFPLHAWAGPIADPGAPAGQRPAVTTAPTGVPMVNIAAPNAAGLSYNRYERFDVDPAGLLLNNSTSPQISTLGVAIPANPNLAGTSASTILNQVVTALPSQLNGPLAVLGAPARVIIANPNGITCNGCAFLNTPQVQLTTGTPGFLDAAGNTVPFEQASALSYQVSGGRIEFTGQGLSSILSRLDLIAETLRADAPLNIGDGALNLIAGRQTVNAESLARIAAPGNDRATIGQDWAVDGTVLGAMNAGTIKIIATAAGMGVRADAALAASSGDLVLNSNGDLSVRSAAAARNVDITATGTATNNGQILAGGNLALSAASLDNRGQFMAAIGDIAVTAPVLDNTGGAIVAGGNLSLALPGGSFDLSGTPAGILASDGALAIQADTLANSGSFGHTGPLHLTAGTFTNSGLLVTQGAATLDAGTIVNSGTLAAGTTLTAHAATSLLNTGIWAAGGDMALASANLDNSGTISSDTNLALVTPVFANSGMIVALGDLALSSVTNFANSSVVAAGNDAAFTLGSAASNAGGLLTAGNDLALATAAAGNFGGTVGANGDLNLHFADYAHGAGETAFLAGRNLTVTASSLSNAAILAAPQDLAITTSGELSNTGQLLAGQDAAFTVGGTLANAGIVETGRDLSISAAALSNGSGASTVQSWGTSTNMADYRAWVLTHIDDPVIQGKLFNEITPDWQQYNSRFYLLNRWSYFMDSGLEGPYFSLTITRHNSDASLSAGRNLSANVSGTLANNAALITAGNDLTLSAAAFQNLAAQDSYQGVAFAGGGGHTLAAYANSASTVQAGGNVSITAPAQTNTGTIQGNSVYLGGSLVNGLTDYNQPTPVTALPHAVIDLAGTPAGSGSIPAIPAGSAFTPTDPALFSSAARLSLLAPVGQSYLDSLLPESLRNASTPFLMDAWLEQQALKQAALRETGQATFIAGLAYDEDSGLGVDAQQRALLYQAAARFASAEEIRLGVALSEAQQAKLAEPILWYVEESVTGPDGKAYMVLAPRLYLPQGQLGQWANVAGGVIRGVDVTLDAGAGRIENTGYVVAGNTLAVDAGELVNRARSAAWGSFTMDVEGGLLEVWGDRVQPGGFLSAAKLDLDVGRIESISGEFLEGGADASGDLASRLGADFSRSVNQDNTHTLFHADESIGLEQLVIMVVGVAVSIYTAGAASGAIAAAAESSAVAAGSVVAGSSAATAVGTAAASSAWGMAASSAAGAMASSAVTGALSGDFSLDNVLMSGLTAGLTAGLTNVPLFDGQSLNQWANVQATAGNITGTFNPDTFGQNLLGMAGRGVVNAGVNTALYGGSFGEAFTNSFVNDLAAVGANAVGQATNPGSFGNVAGHAMVGAAAAGLKGEDAVAGAIGGASSALLAPEFDQFTSDEDATLRSAQLTASTMLAGGVIADALGHDPIAAAQAAQNEVSNNYLTRAQKTLMLAEIEACKGGVFCKAQVYGKYGAVSASQDVALAQGVVVGSAGRIYEAGEGAISALKDIPGTIKTLRDFINSEDAIGKLSYDTVQEYKQRLDLFETNYQAGGKGSFDAGVELGRLIVDGVGVASGIGGAAKLTASLGVKIVESAGNFAGKAPAVGGRDTGAAIGAGANSAPLNAGWRPLGIEVKANDLPVGQQMIQALEAGGVSPQDAIRYANGYLESGSTVPVGQQIQSGQALVKIVPVGTEPSANTGYWMTPQALQHELQDPLRLTQRLGLPPSQANATSFDIYQIQAKQPTMVFQSTVAPTVDSSTGLTQTGGAQQTIVPNRALFNPPQKAGSVKIGG